MIAVAAFFASIVETRVSKIGDKFSHLFRIAGNQRPARNHDNGIFAEGTLP